MVAVQGVQRIVRFGCRPLFASGGHEQTGNHAHAAFSDRFAGRIVVVYGDPIAVVGEYLHAEPLVEAPDGYPGRLAFLFDGKSFPDDLVFGDVLKNDLRGIFVHVGSHDHQAADDGRARFVGA